MSAYATKTAANPDVLEFYKNLPFNYYGSATTQAKMIRAQDLTQAYPPLAPLLSPSLQVLEVGCGAGWFALTLQLHHRCAVTALDFNPVAIERAREMARLLRQDVTFEVADLFLYEPPSPAELVISIGVLHHTNDCLGAIERLCGRFAAAGGHVFIGLYHRYGRRPFLQHFEKMKAAAASEEALFAEYRRLHAQLKDDTFARSWFRDQVMHPHETQHTLAELLPVFTKTGMQLVSTSLNKFRPIENVEEILSAETDYETLAAEALRRGEYHPGFFTVLARKVS